MNTKELSNALEGEIFHIGSHGFEKSRKVWNGLIDVKPEFIVKPRIASDVKHSIDFVRENGLRLSIKGGGHSISGLGVCDAGVMLDMSLMKKIKVDSKNKSAKAGAGLTWGEFDYETQKYGLATTGAVVSTVGIAGSTLGGGFGWLMGKYGLSCDNVISLDMVSAEGKLLTASEFENQDLFWALRGGGGNFGVVTSFEYKLHLVSNITGGFVAYPLDMAKEFIDFFKDFYRNAPDELMAIVIFFQVSGGVTGVGAIVAYPGSVEVGKKVLQSLKDFGPPFLDQIKNYKYIDFQKILDFTSPHGHSYHTKSNYINLENKASSDVIVESFTKIPSKNISAMIELQFIPEKVRRFDKNYNAFGHRKFNNNLVVVTSWQDPKDLDMATNWLEETILSSSPYFQKGVYVNYLGDEKHEVVDRISEAYNESVFNRLRKIKTKYDPENFFRINQNIKPFT